MVKIYQLVEVPTLNYGHKMEAVAKRINSQKQKAYSSFFRRVSGLRLIDLVCVILSVVALPG